MKRLVTILLTFIYALSSTGFAVKADYCCQKLQSVQLILAEGLKDEDGCCKVKYQSLKVNDTHAAAELAAAPVLPFTFLHTSFYSPGFLHPASSNNSSAVSIHAPPLVATSPAYISNCVFRI